jgi:hypothetical protein
MLSVDSFNEIKNTLFAPVALNITQKRNALRAINTLKKTTDNVNGVIAALQEGRAVRSFLSKLNNFLFI